MLTGDFTLARSAPAAASGPSAPTAVFHYKRLIFADSAQDLAAKKGDAEAGPVVVRNVPVLATKDFSALAATYVGQPITTESVNRLAKDVDNYVKHHDRLVVNVQMPNQDISAGEFRMIVIIGRYSQLAFRGNRWFSDKLLESKLGVKPGDEIRLSVLESAVAWANTNPFRHVEVLVNTMNKQPGVADLDVTVHEHFPMRFTASYDDTGNDVIGNNHYTGALQFGNLWGLDHQASYQYTTTDHLKIYQSHNLDYRIPLPWHHTLVFDAAYAEVQPTFYNGLLVQKGKNLIGDLHYLAPFHLKSWTLESSTGLDFKRSNNNLLFGGLETNYKSSIDIAQLNSGLTAYRPDRHGISVFAFTLNVSPGNFDEHNTDAAFAAARGGSRARYVYGTLVVQRRVDLPAGFQAFTRAVLQGGSTNLTGSEQITVGGQASVRGYNELLYAGDQGLTLSEELQGPTVLAPLGFLPKGSSPLVLRPLVFWDYARVAYKHPQPFDIVQPPLMSTGVGLRCNLASNLTVSLDYGWQLLEYSATQPNHARGHIKATIAY